MNEINKNHIDRIDVLRGIAVLGIFLYHSQLGLFNDIPLEHFVNGKIEVPNFKSIIINVNIHPL